MHNQFSHFTSKKPIMKKVLSGELPSPGRYIEVTIPELELPLFGPMQAPLFEDELTYYIRPKQLLITSQ